MSGPISNSKKFSEYLSHSKLAKAIIAANREVNWGMNERSLGNRLAELDKGKTIWWHNKPTLAQLLVDFLEISKEDLGLHEKTCSIALHFQEFPELPPLDFKNDESWQIANEELDSPQEPSDTAGSKPTLELWLRKQPAWVRQPPTNVDWLCVTDDLHRNILASEMSASSHHEVVFTDTLGATVVRLRNQKPVIVVVQQDGGDSDLAALAERPEGAGILIIAPFMLGHREEGSTSEWRSWEARTTKGKDKRIFELSTQSLDFSHTIKRWVLRKHPDWRERLLTWVEHRLDHSKIDTYFSAQAVSEWLKSFDKSEQWFCTTSDLMQLCHLVHRYSEKRLPQPNDPEAGNHLASLLFEREPITRKHLIKNLADLRWDSKLSWIGSLPLKDWFTIAGSEGKTISRTDLDLIVKPKTLRQRTEAANNIMASLEVGNPESLLHTGLLKEVNRGNFDFQYRTFANLLARDRLLAQISKDPLDAWALNCFDPTRRSLLDAAFDAAPIESLLRTADLLKDKSIDSAQSIAAAETIFIAIGKRIARLENIPTALIFIAKQVFRNLDRSKLWEMDSPLTRPMESNDERLAWVSACWSWSLLPEAKVDESAEWTFPGWAKELPKSPRWLESLMPRKEDDSLPPAFLDFWLVLSEWAKEIDSPEKSWPPVIIAAFLCKTVKSGKPAQSFWWKTVIGHQWAEKLILECCQNFGREASLRLWPSFITAEREVASAFNSIEKNSWNIFDFQESRIRLWMLEHLKPAEIIGNLDTEDLRYLARQPETIPPWARSDLLVAVKDCPPIRGFSTAMSFFKRFGHHATPALENFFEHEDLGHAAIECLWLWKPERALELLDKKYTANSSVKRELYWQCPPQYFANALDLISDNPSVFDHEELKIWIRRYLPNARENAVRALALLKKR